MINTKLYIRTCYLDKINSLLFYMFIFWESCFYEMIKKIKFISNQNSCRNISFQDKWKMILCEITTNLRNLRWDFLALSNIKKIDCKYTRQRTGRICSRTNTYAYDFICFSILFFKRFYDFRFDNSNTWMSGISNLD